MSTKITVKLADSLYERTQRFAELHQQEMDDVISSLIEAGLAAKEATGEGEEEIQDWSESDPMRDREWNSYTRLHPELKKRYLGKYVAIYHGELVDVDEDAEKLEARTEAKYGGDYVFVTQVRPEVMQTFVIRSPRILRD